MHKTSINLTIFLFCILLVSLCYLVICCRTSRFVDLWLTRLRYRVRWFFCLTWFGTYCWLLTSFWYLRWRTRVNWKDLLLFLQILSLGFLHIRLQHICNLRRFSNLLLFFYHLGSIYFENDLSNCRTTLPEIKNFKIF